MHTTTSDQNQKLAHTNNHQIKNDQQLHDYSNHHHHHPHSHHHEHIVQQQVAKNEPQHDYSDINSFHVGRRRKPNFTDQEVVFIIDRYDTYKELLHSREASKSVIAQKQAIWKLITENLNQQYPQVERSVEDVRRKWKKLQSEAKREATAYKQSGQTTSPNTGKQIHLYNRILQICRAPTAHYPLQQIPNAETFEQSPDPSSYNQQTSPQSDTVIQHSPSSLNEQNPDENASVGGDNNYDQENSNNSAYVQPNPLQATTTTTTTTTTASSPLIASSSSLVNDQIQNSPHENSNHYSHPHHPHGGSVSKRTMDKRRRMINAQINEKQAPVTSFPSVPTQSPILPSTMYHQQQTQLRFESLQKRKRTIDLTSQRLIYDKERLIIERKNIDIKLQQNECEHERWDIEKRRTELALQKLQQEATTNGNTSSLSYLPYQSGNGGSGGQQPTSDLDEDSMADDMSDFNE
ncbi:unnamed protein product [Didymodactylos carnosus]|uniref:Myb/SANT-like DNA-binding domain-containing protein n=1 Tax=Didymodactylos carnosus TaxID=1234261 RepID=A0A8S2ET11_9BILA|nr:unnamed protein product [Didymodactylos carnosus]CAF4038243.1 unnamed protein product [Didymodactylos carnosus]